MEGQPVSRRLFGRKPRMNEISFGAADCGYVCVAALLARWGVPASSADVKRHGGTTARGLTLRGLRQVMAACGLATNATLFDTASAANFPVPGILLLKRGHYVLLHGRRGDEFEAYYPEGGWRRVPRKRLARDTAGLGLEVIGFDRSSAPRGRDPAFSSDPVVKGFAGAFANRTGVAAGTLIAGSQAASLALPLLVMTSVNTTQLGLGSGTAGWAALAFLLISLTSAAISLMADLANLAVHRLATERVSRRTFDHLLSRPTSWFEEVGANGLQGVLGSVDAQVAVIVRAVTVVGAFAVTFIGGIAALLFVSPWLMIPGLVGLALSIAIEQLLTRRQVDVTFEYLDAQQRKRLFVGDVLSQLPMVARYDGIGTARARFGRLVRLAFRADRALKTLQSLKGSSTSLMRGLENLVFVCLSAYLMAKDNFSLGLFVAVGVYKDLLAQSLYTLFQYAQQYRSLHPHRRLTAELFQGDPAAPPSRLLVTLGRVELEDVWFRYGTLDPYLMEGASASFAPGSCTVVTGPSGTGKSTLLKLAAGVFAPSRGRVLVDGQEVSGPAIGLAAVFQSDRLITESIRENIRFFRPGIGDTEIYAALKEVCLHDFVVSLPMRLDTVVGEGAGGLSGGQRQKVLLARALVGNPRVIILDEATSNIDAEGEAEIIRAVKARGATVIMVAHRPEVLAFADAHYAMAGRSVRRVGERPSPAGPGGVDGRGGALALAGVAVGTVAGLGSGGCSGPQGGP